MSWLKKYETEEPDYNNVEMQFGGLINPEPAKRQGSITFPGTKDVPNNEPSTHLYASGKSDGKNYAFPTLFQTSEGGWYQHQDPFGHALEIGEAIEFKNQRQAQKFAKGSWKKEMADGGLIKRADGSYSKRGLWDNIRANKGSGKKPTKEMLEQERKIKAQEKQYGGEINEDPIPTVNLKPVEIVGNKNSSQYTYNDIPWYLKIPLETVLDQKPLGKVANIVTQSLDDNLSDYAKFLNLGLEGIKLSTGPFGDFLSNVAQESISGIGNYNPKGVDSAAKRHWQENSRKPLYKYGGVIKDDRGQWAYPGYVTEINSPDITMQGVPYPVIGVSDIGDTKLMMPEQDYKFKGNKVTEYPVKLQAGGRMPIYLEDNPENRRKVQAYQDSLNLYNRGEEKLKYWRNNPNASNIELNIREQEIDREIPVSRSRDAFGSNGIRAIDMTPIGTGSSSRLVPIYQKPIQPYKIQERETLSPIQNSIEPVGLSFNQSNTELLPDNTQIPQNTNVPNSAYQRDFYEAATRLANQGKSVGRVYDADEWVDLSAKDWNEIYSTNLPVVEPKVKKKEYGGWLNQYQEGGPINPGYKTEQPSSTYVEMQPINPTISLSQGKINYAKEVAENKKRQDEAARDKAIAMAKSDQATEKKQLQKDLYNQRTNTPLGQVGKELTDFGTSLATTPTRVGNTVIAALTPDVINDSPQSYTNRVADAFAISDEDLWKGRTGSALDKAGMVAEGATDLLLEMLPVPGLGNVKSGARLLKNDVTKSVNYLKDLPKEIAYQAPRQLQKAKVLSSPSTQKALNTLDKNIQERMLRDYISKQRNYKNINKGKSIEIGEGDLLYPSLTDFRKALKEAKLNQDRVKKLYPDVDFNKPASGNVEDFQYFLGNPKELQKYAEIQKTFSKTKETQKKVIDYIEKQYNQKMGVIGQNKVLKSIAEESPQYTDIIYEHIKNPQVTDNEFVTNLVKQSNTFTRALHKPVENLQDLLTIKGRSLVTPNKYSIDVEGFPASGRNQDYGNYRYKIEPDEQRMLEVSSLPIEQRWAARFPQKSNVYNSNVDITEGFHTQMRPEYENWWQKRHVRNKRDLGREGTFSISPEADFNIPKKYVILPQHQTFSSSIFGENVPGFKVSEFDIPKKFIHKHIPGFTKGFKMGGWLNKYN